MDDNQTSQGGQTAGTAQIQEYLQDVNYPASKEDLISTARQQGAPDDVITALEKLPEQEYNSPTDISSAM